MVEFKVFDPEWRMDPNLDVKDFKDDLFTMFNYYGYLSIYVKKDPDFLRKTKIWWEYTNWYGSTEVMPCVAGVVPDDATCIVGVSHEFTLYPVSREDK